MQFLLLEGLSIKILTIWNEKLAKDGEMKLNKVADFVELLETFGIMVTLYLDGLPTDSLQKTCNISSNRPYWCPNV